MTTISQTIPNFVLGISEQPDQLKSPGQVRDLVNAVPDVTLMCAKRPGSEFITAITDLETAPDVKWFDIDRSEYEQYMGRIKPDGTIDMWRLVNSSGPFVNIKTAGSGITDSTYYNTTTSGGSGTGLTLDITVVSGSVTTAYIKSYGQNYITGDVISATIDSNTVEFYYFECTPRANVDTGGTGYSDGTVTVSGIELTLTTSNGAITSAEITNAGDGSLNSGDTLTVVQTGGQNGTLTYKTGKAGEQLVVGYEGNAQTYLANNEPSYNIKHLTVGDYTFLVNRQKPVSMTNQTGSGAAPATQVFKIEYTSTYAPVATDKLEITLNGPSTAEADTITYTGYTSWTDWATNVATQLASYSSVASAVADSNNTNTAGFITVTMTGTELYELTLKQTNSAGTTAGSYLTTLRITANVDFERGNIGFIQLTNLSGNKKYEFKLVEEDGTEHEYSYQLGALASTTSGDTVLDGLLPAHTNTKWMFTKIGTGIFVYSPYTKFNIKTSSSNVLNVFTDSVQNVALLPTQCKHGYKVKVANSDTVDDDYYVKFIGTNEQDGVGYWEETVGKNVLTKIDPDTMPHQLRRNSDNSFTLVNIDYADRLIGDDTTNQPPSFVGSYTPQKENAQAIGARYINNIVSFRNRLGFLSGDNIILSRPGKFFNFFNATAITISAEDPIDIAVSDTQPATLYDAIEANVGLVLFSRSQQFLLTTDGDTLSPATASATFISSYNYNTNVAPISLGTTQAFVKDDGRNTQFFEMQTQKRDGEPELLELSKIISAKLPTGINKLSNSRGSGTVLMSKKGSGEIWGHRYFNTGEERLQSSWFRWVMQDNVYHHCLFRDNVYLVQKYEDQLTIQKIDLKRYDNSFTYAGDSYNYRVHLDNRYIVHNAGQATILPYDVPTTLEIPLLGAVFGKIFYHHEETGKSGTLTVSGGNSVSLLTETDLQTGTLHLGYQYEMRVEFPKLYPTQGEGRNVKSDVNGSLTLHRAKLSCGSTGAFDILLERKGQSDITNSYEPTTAPFNLDSNAFLPDRIVTVPIYARNTNTDITFKSKYTTPTTLISLTWEGDYTNKMYQRA